MHIDGSCGFLVEKESFSGVKKIADRVRLDVKRVTGKIPAQSIKTDTVFIATVGKSELLNTLDEEKLIDLSNISGKREVYLFKVISGAKVEKIFPGANNVLVIAGSDKRGTIYGSFHLSEVMGVSPFVEWTNAIPLTKNTVTITEKNNFISKEPSVRYRGFFINDEWPAFGNWANHNFGGINAKMYENVFMLLLRMKGNYLWPAMWASRFSDDGPGLQNAELADELGVVMGASHHEPCCRAGEEYKYLRGKNSKYGDAWNFIKNKEGITKFWEDGLKRNGKFENVITVGMRGEADTAILGNHATLGDNINLLHDVLKTQNELIAKYVNKDVTQVPRMLALYKEVEPYFYGDKTYKGLIGCKELDGVTLMLCDDNHGNLRTVPTKKMQNHNGGYGMYYHLDYHGSPFSYEWINTSTIAKVKEQMSAAYDFGIRDLWIVNVGDIASTEFPLSYFLNLAYDYDKYSSEKYTPSMYTKDWVSQQFPLFSEKQKKLTEEVLNGYTKLAFLRRTECLSPETYHPVNFSEADRVLSSVEKIMTTTQKLRDEIEEKSSKIKGEFPAFFSNVYYPAMGTMNIIKMQILSGKNHWYANNGIIDANDYVQKVKDCLEFDKKLVKENDSVDKGRWYAMGWSEHFGFTRWNEEENKYPLYMTIEGTRKPRLVVWVEGSSITTSGLDWSRKVLCVNSFNNPEVDNFVINISSGCVKEVPFEIKIDKPWLKVSKSKGTVNGLTKIVVKINRTILANDKDEKALLEISNKDRSAGGVKIPIYIFAESPTKVNCKESNVFYQTEPYVSIEACHYSSKKDGISIDDAMTGKGGTVCSFKELPDYGKSYSAMKVYPVTTYFDTKLKNAPYLEYNVVLAEDGIYDFRFLLNPSNPATKDNNYKFAVDVNGSVLVKDVVPKTFAVGDNQEPWGTDVTNNIRVSSVKMNCKKGLNTLKVFAITPCFVLEKIVITKDGYKLPESYLGPEETYFIK